MTKNILLLLFTLFSFSAIHAEKSWEINGIKCNLSDDGTLTISGTGDMPNYSAGGAPWYNDEKKIKTVVIEDGVTNIGNHAFYYCTALTSVTIPNSVTSIGAYAFYGCSGLSSITIPNYVTNIGDWAFYGCSGLTSVTIGNSVTSIGKYAFRACSGLASITIPNSVTSIGDGAFDGCSSLTSITIPNSVTNINNRAFYGCSGLTSVTIPNSVSNIGYNAFYGCSGLTSITIPNSVVSIAGYAFGGCSGLTSITFERTTSPMLGEGVFNDVDKSIPVYVPRSSVDEYKEALGGYFEETSIQPITIYLTEGDAYTNDSQIDNVDVSYTRNFTNTNWQALYLPFSLKYEDWKDDFEVARINAVRQYDDNDDGNIDRTVLEFVKMTNDDSVIEPNTPYLIKAKEAGKKTISVENTTLYESKANSIECSTTTELFTFTGTYNVMSFSGIGAYHNCYVLGSTGRNIIEGKTFLPPYRWYMKMKERESVYGIKNNTAKEISIRVVGEEATGIANIQHASPNTQTYDLNGRRVNENNLKPGMYIKNGRKFVIK